MAKRIGTLQVGEQVRLRFHGSKQFGNEPYELDLIFLRRGGKGEDERATFIDESGPEVEVYRSNGHWAYGSGAERLSIVA